VAVILINFTGNNTQPYTPAQVKSNVFTSTSSVNSYYKEISFGKIALAGNVDVTGDVFGWYTLTNSITTCDWPTWTDAAKAKLTSAGINTAAYNNFIVIGPNIASCGVAGVAWMPGDTSYINGYGTDARVVSHEIGHNFGVHHAASINCTSSTGTRVTLSDTCTEDEYGDWFDVMGFGWRHENNYQKGRLQYYAYASNTQTVPMATSQQYKVAPVEKATTEIQALRVPRAYDSAGNPTSFFYVEYRTPYGFDNFAAGSPVISGVSIRISTDYSVLSKTQLLDMTPATSTYDDSALLVGKEFYDSKTGIRIKTISVDATGAVVSVSTPTPPCTRANPSVSITPTSQWGNPGNTLGYQLSVTNKDGSYCAASTFNLTTTQPSGFAQTPATTSVSLAPGASTTITFQVAAGSSVASGNYSFTETVTNASATTYKAAVSGAFNIYDQNTLPPVVSIINPANGAKVGMKASVQANATSKTSISKMEVYINNILVKSVSGVTTVEYNLNTRKEKAGTITITVKAYDTAGRSGVATISVYK